MTDRYDFGNLSPIEFESLCVDLVSAETGLRFERFSEGPDGGIDGRHSQANGDTILQAKHYKGSSWPDLQRAVKHESKSLSRLNPAAYYLLTSQPLTPPRKETIASILDHSSVAAANIWGRAELNGLLAKHAEVERRNIKLWLSSAAVLDRLLKSDIAVFTEATYEEIERILKVFVVNPSLRKSSEILNATHCLIVSGPPGVGKTTLAQVLAAEYSDEGWELVSVASIEDGFRVFQRDKPQVFVFDDFLGKIRLDPASLARDDDRIVRFMSMVHRDKAKRFILTTRSYILQAARTLSEALDDKKVEISEMVLNLASYTRELKARILYNHLYHSELNQASIQVLLSGDAVRQIVDHRNYMPRIIQWMTDEIRQRDVPESDYPKVFLQALDNPDKIWDKAFRQHISLNARILLYCMYFAEQERFGVGGIAIDKLRVFFERAILAFGSITKEELRTSIFEETLREVKSSFVVLNGSVANFINPSVQDYLSREAIDPTVLSTLARCVPSVSTAHFLWKRMGTKSPIKIRSQVAGALLRSLTSPDMEGRLALHIVADMIGELILTTNDISYCELFRRRSYLKISWVDVAELPKLIETLEGGRFSQLPYSRVYARYLRLQIFKSVPSDGDDVIDLEELATLATKLASSKVEMSEQFCENFDRAVEVSVDALDMDTIPQNEDAEGVINEWLNNIARIEDFTSTAVDPWKKSQFQERIILLQRLEAQRQQEEYELAPRSHVLRKPSYPSGTFSNEDIQSMFSSLKKAE